MYKIKMLNSVSDEMKKKVIEMDNAAFPVDDWGTLEEAEIIYTAKNDSLILLLKDDEPVGFLTIFATNRMYFENAARTDCAFYSSLTHEILSDEKTDAVYCHCFLLLPEHRGHGLVYALYKCMKEWLVSKGTDPGHPVYAEAVSNEGLNCLKRIGFKTIHDYAQKGKLQAVSCGDALANIDSLIKDMPGICGIPVEMD